MHSSFARSRRAAPSTAFPTRQLTILALCRLCEPIAFMSIFPYVYYMVQSFHITSSDDKRTAMYAGMVTSAFAFAEFSTGVVWGRISDKFGRKPVLLCGLAGTGISMLVFGFSPNLTTALIARALGGLLNGNIGVINTTVAEFVTVKAHQPRAFSIMPSVWCIGSIIGAGLGGTLADPVRNYPAYFERGTIFDKFPYLLPNIICCIVVLISLTIGLLFLEETHEEKKYRRDIGLEIGDWILSFFGTTEICDKGGLVDEGFHLLVDGQLAEYSSTEASPALSPVTVNVGQNTASHSSRDETRTSKKDLGFCAAFDKRVLVIIISYGILAYHTISAEQLLPVLLSLPNSDEKPDLPFHFLGGLELSTKSIGYILSSQGFIQTISTLFVFPFVTKRVGTLATFRMSVLSYPFLYLVVPYVTILPQVFRMPALYVIVVWKVTAQSFAFPPLQILLANSARSNKVLGTLNGTAASSASLCRAIGPTLSGFIQSAGLSLGSVGLPWWANCLVAVLGALLSLSMTSTPQHEASEKDAQEIEEAADVETSQIGGHMDEMADSADNADVAEEPLTLDRRS